MSRLKRGERRATLRRRRRALDRRPAVRVSSCHLPRRSCRFRSVPRVGEFSSFPDGLLEDPKRQAQTELLVLSGVAPNAFANAMPLRPDS